jgi:acyl-CoA thioesterase
MRFADATEVVADGPGSYHGEIIEGWDIFGVTNGGYLLAMVARAMALEAPGRRLLSVTARYPGPARPGPIRIVIETIKVGRSLTTLSGFASQDGRPVVSLSASLGTDDTGDARHHLRMTEPPDLPPPDQCVRLQPASEGDVPPRFTRDVDIRLHPEDMRGGGEPRIRGWFHLLDGEPLDSLALVFVCDAFPPAIFNSTLPMGWTPTIDLAVQIRDPGPHEWVACQFTTRHITGGLLEEDGEVWSPDGELVALSRQLALVPRH